MALCIGFFLAFRDKKRILVTLALKVLRQNAVVEEWVTVRGNPVLALVKVIPFGDHPLQELLLLSRPEVILRLIRSATQAPLLG